MFEIAIRIVRPLSKSGGSLTLVGHRQVGYLMKGLSHDFYQHPSQVKFCGPRIAAASPRLVQVVRAGPGPAVATNARARPAGTRTQATNLKQATILRAASSPNLKRDYSR